MLDVERLLRIPSNGSKRSTGVKAKAAHVETGSPNIDQER